MNPMKATAMLAIFAFAILTTGCVSADESPVEILVHEPTLEIIGDTLPDSSAVGQTATAKASATIEKCEPVYQTVTERGKTEKRIVGYIFHTTSSASVSGTLLGAIYSYEISTTDLGGREGSFSGADSDAIHGKKTVKKMFGERETSVSHTVSSGAFIVNTLLEDDRARAYAWSPQWICGAKRIG